MGSRPFLAVPLLVMGLVACQANPGEPPTVEDPTTETSTTPPSAPPPEDQRELHVGVEAFSGNLNPHLLGNVNPVVMAIADLTLPSAFVYRSGQLVVDEQLLRAVKPNDAVAPTEVLYTLNPAAQWSDGTPVTISDFRYLQEEITSSPVASQAGAYAMISSIEPTGTSGFTVTFTQPFRGWKELFHHLLPSHIYGAEQRPFSTMMDNSLAASGGAYAVASVDSGRGRVELRRNDRYWGDKPAVTDKLVLDRIPNLPTGAQMLRSGQLEVLITHPEEITSLALQSIPGVQQRPMSRSVDLSVVFNMNSAVIAQPQERARIVDAINPDDIAKIAVGRLDVRRPDQPSISALGSAGGSNTMKGSASASVAASSADASPPEPTKSPPTQSKQPTDTHSRPAPGTTGKQGDKDDSKEQLVVGAPTDDAVAVNASRVLVDQLRAHGIPARSVSVEDSDLYGTQVPQGAVDILVSWQRTARTATELWNQYSCVEAAETTELRPSNGNMTGLCDPVIQQRLTRIMDGKANLEQYQAEIEQRIAQANVIIPLVRDEEVVAIGSGIRGPSAELDGWPVDPYSGVLVSAPTWAKQETGTRIPTLEGR